MLKSASFSIDTASLEQPGFVSSNSGKPTIVDLFAGVGGFSLGAARAGFELSLAVEWDKHAHLAHSINFPHVRHSTANIAEMNGRELLSLANLATGELCGLIGGPPCQGFSTIGHRSVVDPRNNLFVKFFELVAESRPDFFIAENVLGILDDIYAPIRKEAMSRLAGQYTVLKPIKLKASKYGAPTIRERAFFIGYREETMSPLTRPDFTKARIRNSPKVATALRGLPTIRSDWKQEEQGWRQVVDFPKGRFGERVTGMIPQGVGDEEAISLFQNKNLVSGCLGTQHTPEVRARFAKLKPGKMDKISKAVRLSTDGFCPTLRAGTGSDRGSYQAIRPVHPTSPRVITPREAARLQGFPDWFQFAPSKWHSFRQIGNSVSPLVAEAVLRVIFERLLRTTA